jgi:hypothetical protein
MLNNDKKCEQMAENIELRPHHFPFLRKVRT